MSNAFIDKLKVEISPSQIDLKQEINKLGKYSVNINLHSEVSVKVTISVGKIDSAKN